MLIPTATKRRSLITACSIAAGLGWVMFQLAVEVMLGPHITVGRSMTIGSAVGALVGLFMGGLQWRALHRYTRSAGLWVPVTTVGCTLAGLVGSIALYYAALDAGFYASVVAIEGVLPSAIVGAIVALFQWLVLRKWSHHTRSWIPLVAIGTGLAVLAAYLTGLSVLGLLTWVLGVGAWPVVLSFVYLIGSAAGGAVFALFTAWAFRRVLPPAHTGARVIPDAVIAARTSAQPAQAGDRA
ncbi:MAG TPA: hypothetical protein VFR15_20070 [Chloroflexia bacterium]|nr:hypothetical protein [Chloroflexia bacterium]